MYFSTKHFNLLRQNEVLMRQLILFLKRKMDAKFASTNSGRSAVWPILQYFLQIVPKKFSAYYKCFVQYSQVHWN